MALPTLVSERLEVLRARGGRCLLGLCGAPGGGKSTLAAAIVAEAGPSARLVPMDGFHLAQAELDRLGRAARKGAPDTFDVWGYVALLRRLREPVPGETVYAPAFHREIEQPVAGEIAVPAEASLIVTEGNYLLLDGDWGQVRALLDEIWFIDTDPALRDAWLLARHMRYGRTRAEAEAWIAQTDEPNARRINDTRQRADRIIGWPIRETPTR